MSGTPQGYVAWVTGLSEGDTVTATMWMKGASNGVDNDGKGRLWGHYSSNDDITTYFGSASGSGDYAGEGGIWTQASHTWTIAEGQTALVIEARMYSYGSNNILLGDDLTVSTNNDGATITLAGVDSRAPGVRSPCSVSRASPRVDDVEPDRRRRTRRRAKKLETVPRPCKDGHGFFSEPLLQPPRHPS